MYRANIDKLKREIDRSTIIVRDFNTPLSIRDRTTRQKINKDIEDLNKIVDEIYTEHYAQQQQNTHFSSNVHVTFSGIDHVRPQNKS